jgi:phosphatidate cytidylyltransferase
MTTEPDQPDHEDGSGSSWVVVGGRNLPLAIAVGVAVAALFLITLYWDPLALSLLIAILTALAYVESNRVMTPIGLPLPVPVLVVATLAMLGGAFTAGHTGQMIGLLILVLGAIAWQLADRAREDVVRRLGVTLLFGLWVGFLGSFAVLLIERSAAGPIGVLAVIGAAILTDIGGYAFGVPLGRHKIAPSVSPSKSWEGLIGGLVVATLAGAFVLPHLDDRFGWQLGVAVALACGIAGFVGDLTESMVKRDLGLKDLGDLLPGHGGVLDRVDGVLFALPVGYLLLEVAL